jgi:putative phosphoesterase
MKIALFSDIHANLPALEAFFDDLSKRDVDALFCLGDLVGYNVWPNEVIREIRKRRITVIAGNYDQGIGNESDDCGCAYKTETDKAMGKISIAYTNQVTAQAEKAYLRDLASHIRLEFKTESGLLNLLLVHGSPRKVNEYLFEDRDEKSLLRIMEQARADIMCFGHTHIPYHRILPAADGRYLHAINTGSVGKPKDGDKRGCYVILDINKKTKPEIKDSLTVEFIRFDYDIEMAAQAIEKSELPDAYAEMLRKGI